MTQVRREFTTLGFLLLLFILLLVSGCATTTSENASAQGAGLGAVVGAATGALLDHHNPWRGAVIGATAGAILGGGLTEISQQASAQAAQTNQPVVYRQGNTVVEATPMAYNQQTHCHKIHKRIWENGRLVADRIEEVCEGTKTTNTY